MRQSLRVYRLLGPVASTVLVALAPACSSSSPSGFGTTGGSDAGTTVKTTDATTTTTVGDTGTGITPTEDVTTIHQTDAGLGSPDGTTVVTTVTTIYAHTDTELYSMDPMTNVVTDVGTFTGTSGSSTDGTITDLAVDAENDIYVCTESVIYQVTLPATPAPGATVQLTKKATISATGDGGVKQRFYALAFTPAGLLGTGETLVGGDSNGELWAIPTTGAAATDLGNFGTDPDKSTSFLALSGDLVFYTSGGNATGLATIRSCSTSHDYTTCVKTDDYLAGVNITNLKANYTAGTHTASLLGGIYGGTTTADGNGTGYGELFGLGAWNSNVYAFSRCLDCYDGGTNAAPARLIQINASTGAGTIIGPTFSFTDGWSGAGVTTKVTVTVTVPPMTAPPASK